MAVAYPAAPFQQLPDELEGKYVAGISCSVKNFDQQASTRSEQIAEVQDWGMKVVRTNDTDASCDYEPNLATAQATSAALLDHTGNLIEDLSSRGIYYMAAGLLTWLCSSLGPIDRNSTIRSLFSAAGFPITGAGGLYATLGMGTGDAWGVDRTKARQVIYEIAIFHDYGYAIGSGPVQPGPSRESEPVRQLIEGIWSYVDAALDDYVARTGIDDPSKKIIIAPFNGPESSRETTINPWWPHESPYGYFGNASWDLKQSVFKIAWKTGTGEDFYPSTQTDTENNIDLYAHQRFDWAAAFVCEKVNGNRSASNAILTQSIHHYREGSWALRWAGNPASDIVTEFGIARRYLESKADSTERPSPSNSYYLDADDGFYITVPAGSTFQIGYGVPGFGAVANVAAHATSSTVRTAIESLPGIPLSDMTVENHWNNITPISSWSQATPDGVAMYSYHVRMGTHSPSDSKSKFKRGAGKLWSPTAGVQIYQHMRGGEVDRGPALRQFVRDMVGQGRKMMIYHCPYDTRILRLWQDNDGSTRLTRGDAETVQSLEWFRAGNHESAPGAKPRTEFIGGPFWEDEPQHYKFMHFFGKEMRRLNG